MEADRTAILPYADNISHRDGAAPVSTLTAVGAAVEAVEKEVAKADVVKAKEKVKEALTPAV